MIDLYFYEKISYLFKNNLLTFCNLNINIILRGEKMNYNNRWSEVKYLCELKNISLIEISKRCGISLFYLRKRVKSGNDELYKKCKSILR